MRWHLLCLLPSQPLATRILTFPSYPILSRQDVDLLRSRNGAQSIPIQLRSSRQRSFSSCTGLRQREAPTATSPTFSHQSSHPRTSSSNCASCPSPKTRRHRRHLFTRHLHPLSLSPHRGNRYEARRRSLSSYPAYPPLCRDQSPGYRQRRRQCLRLRVHSSSCFPSR